MTDTFAGMDRRVFLLGAAATGVVGCTAPERDLLENHPGSDLTTVPPATASTQPGSSSTPPDDSSDAAPADPTDPGIDPDTDLPVSVPAEDLPGLSFVARAVVPTVVVDEVLGRGDARWTFDNPIESGGQLVFLIEEFDRLDNFRVLLPTRPNGSFGWIRAGDVKIDRHNFAIRVELDAYRLTVLHKTEPVFETVCGVARENAPTPLGRYYLTEILRPPRPDTVYGAFAYGLSGYSETFTAFNGGPGQLGIHGTDDPATLGTNVSSGCIRLHNDDITHLVEGLKVPTGAPVEVI